MYKNGEVLYDYVIIGYSHAAFCCTLHNSLVCTCSLHTDMHSFVGHRQNVTVLRINQVDVSADID